MPHDQTFSSIVSLSQRDQAQSTSQRLLSELLESRTYNQSEVQNWTAEVSEKVALALKDISCAFKYTVTCVVMQKGEAGLHMSSTCYWDSTTDGSFSIKWENGSMHCILNVFALVLY